MTSLLFFYEIISEIIHIACSEEEKDRIFHLFVIVSELPKRSVQSIAIDGIRISVHQMVDEELRWHRVDIVLAIAREVDIWYEEGICIIK